MARYKISALLLTLLDPSFEAYSSPSDSRVQRVSLQYLSYEARCPPLPISRRSSVSCNSNPYFLVLCFRGTPHLCSFGCRSPPARGRSLLGAGLIIAYKCYISQAQWRIAGPRENIWARSVAGTIIYGKLDLIHPYSYVFQEPQDPPLFLWGSIWFRSSICWFGY